MVKRRCSHKYLKMVIFPNYHHVFRLSYHGSTRVRNIDLVSLNGSKLLKFDKDTKTIPFLLIYLSHPQCKDEHFSFKI